MFKKYFFAGLLVWVPLWVTLLAIRFLVELFDSALLLLPIQYQPSTLLGWHIPGLGIAFTLILMFLTGVFVTHLLGHKLVAFWESLLARIPIVRSIYNAVKQVLNSVLADKSEAFRNVLLVEYPRRGMWSIAFQTSKGLRQAKDKLGESLITIFVPTTPNPTSGFLMMILEEDAILLDMTVDDALKMVVSLGMVLPTKPSTKLNIQPS